MRTRQFETKTSDLIVFRGEVVMSRSETPFFTKIFRRLSALQPDDVLEVGFGLGISAALIQKYLQPKQHDIVEIEPSIFRDLQAFAKTRPGVGAIKGDFARFKPTRKYDFIFFDTFDYSARDDAPGKTEARWAQRMRQLLKPGGTVCTPGFGEASETPVPGLRRTLCERFRVAPYLLEDGTRSSVGILECWQPD